MSNVCRNCFKDEELLGFITSQSRIDTCSFCGSKNIECVFIDELYDFFSELLSCFKNETTGRSLSALIQDNWNFFGSKQLSENILNHVINNIKTLFNDSHDKVVFCDEILDNINHWDKLRKELIEKSRYITDIEYLTNELGWDSFFQSQIRLESGKKLFRARLHHDISDSTYSNTEMFAPPKEYTTAGRANPSGIPFLYLSDNEQTVLYEIRSSFLDEVSIGTFVLKSDIIDDVYISDFTESVSIFHPSKVRLKLTASLLKEKISFELSKPMRRYDSEIEYIPTQFICEFIKIFTNVKGIKFRSSLHANGNNFVIFQQDIFECTNVKKVKVNKVEIDSTIII